jgi:hypothetical protein
MAASPKGIKLNRRRDKPDESGNEREAPTTKASHLNSNPNLPSA